MHHVTSHRGIHNELQSSLGAFELLTVLLSQVSINQSIIQLVKLLLLMMIACSHLCVVLVTCCDSDQLVHYNHCDINTITFGWLYMSYHGY